MGSQHSPSLLARLRPDAQKDYEDIAFPAVGYAAAWHREYTDSGQLGFTL
jgi:hypothetical protein